MLRNRLEAGHLLSEKLRPYCGSKTVVVAIPHGGIPVGYKIARELEVPLLVTPCKRIEHPACKDKSIGSISLDETIIHPDQHDIPQDYIAHQIQYQKRLLEKQERLFSKNMATNVTNKTVILVDDLLITGDTMLASLRSLLKQEPAQIIVAVPLVSLAGLEVVQYEADNVVYLEMCPDFQTVQKNFEEFSVGDHDELINLLEQASSY
jgi:putative phosphoribosyl transferase